MNTNMKKQFYSGTGLVIIGVLLLAVVSLGNTILGGLRLDLTQNHIYTLSKGTRSLLSKLDEPINLYFFYSRDQARSYPDINSYAQRVQEMLQEITQNAHGRIRLNVVNPEPFSEDEDRAVSMGVKAVSLNDAGDNLYFGLAGTNSVGDTKAIPFFRPGKGATLEYDVAKLIYQLNQDRKPVVGMLSTLPVQGGFNFQQIRRSSGWVSVQQLQQFFDLKKLDKNLTRIPKGVDLLLLIHPADLSDQTLYAVDQFVLGGGKALVFVDPYAEHAPRPGMRNPGKIVVEPESDPKRLLAAWGVRMLPDKILGDAAYALQARIDPSQPAFYHYAMVGVRPASMDQKDVITQGLKQVNLSTPGILEPIKSSGIEFTPLLQSSDQAMPLDSHRVEASMNPAELQNGFKPTGKHYVIAARLHGKAHTAFPDGAPRAPPKKDGAKDTKVAVPAPHLSESKGDINVVVVADTDLLANQLWVRTQGFLGQQIASPFAGNGDLLINAVDNLLGSNDLISIRGRVSYVRPFTRVEALKRQADARFRAKEDDLMAKLRQTEQKLDELQSQKGDGGAVLLSPEQQKTLQRFREEKMRTRKELREVRHQLDKDIERLGSVLKFVNIVLVPLLLVLATLGFALWRRGRGNELKGGHV